MVVVKAERNLMRRYVESRVEDTKRYDILNREEGLVIVRKKKELPYTVEICIILHDKRLTIPAYHRLLEENAALGRYTANVFYKDGENFMVRLAKRGNTKGDNRSLKNYEKEQIDRMIELRGLEKETLKIQTQNQDLVYYQPETERLEEAIRGYSMLPVELDYSHLTPSDPGYDFVESGSSENYRIAELKYQIQDGKLIFELVDENRKIVTLSSK